MTLSKKQDRWIKDQYPRRVSVSEGLEPLVGGVHLLLLNALYDAAGRDGEFPLLYPHANHVAAEGIEVPHFQRKDENT